jgi:glycosyltransferase involved in cell wall biosynthesis
MISVIVPAHNEARVIGRLLGLLISTAQPGELEVIVVANGCTDDTANVAASFGPPVQVLSTPVASKPGALALGDRVAAGFPRIYADADIELGTDDVRALADALLSSGILAAAPQRELALAGRPWLIRWYYDVWTRLPGVQRGLFGRGVICVSEVGHRRIASLPPVIADDLIASLSFTQTERVIANGARVVVHPPRKVVDLLRRRVRATVGVTQIERAADMPESTARTQPSDLLAIARQSPVMTARVAVFAAISVLGRLKARHAVARNDYSMWLRDESSRD